MKKLIGVGLLAAMLMSPAEIAVGAKTAEIPKNKTENCKCANCTKVAL